MQQQRPPELVVPDEDARGLAAYLRLFARILSEASLADVEAWRLELEGVTNVRPLWEIFFQLMCHPVPQVRNDLQGPGTGSSCHKSAMWSIRRTACCRS